MEFQIEELNLFNQFHWIPEMIIYMIKIYLSSASVNFLKCPEIALSSPSNSYIA